MPYYEEAMKTRAGKYNGPEVVANAVTTATWRDAGGMQPGPNADEEAVVDDFIRDLKVRYDPASFNIYVEYTDEDPKLAREAVRAMLEATAMEWESSGASKAETEIAAATKARDQKLVNRFNIERQIDDLSAQFGTTNLEMKEAAIASDLSKLTNDINQLAVAVKLTEDGFAQKSDASVEELAQNNPQLMDMLRDRRVKQNQLNDMLLSFGRNHPSVTRQREVIAANAEEINSYADTLRGGVTTIPNPGGIFGTEETARAGRPQHAPLDADAVEAEGSAARREARRAEPTRRRDERGEKPPPWTATPSAWTSTASPPISASSRGKSPSPARTSAPARSARRRSIPTSAAAWPSSAPSAARPCRSASCC